MHACTHTEKNKTNADRDPPGRQSAKRCRQCWWCCLGWIPKATAASQHHGSLPGRCRHGVVRSAPAVLCCSPLRHNCEEPGQSQQAHIKSQQAHAKSQQAHVKSASTCQVTASTCQVTASTCQATASTCQVTASMYQVTASMCQVTASMYQVTASTCQVTASMYLVTASTCQVTALDVK